MTVEALRSGIDLSFLDTGIRPQDDLFGHVNGRWLADYEIPPDRASDGAFRQLFDRAEVQVRDLITEAAAAAAEPGTDEQRIGDLYASFLDEDTVERRGVQPLLEELAAIDEATDPDALAARSAPCNAPGWAGASGRTWTPTPKTRAATWCT
ncbi:peptidase M13 family protein [Mycobacterium xenopi 4042]|uniref:Peptidase M13 family protein n=1 Tax=Mycobacterium xenopi 4042 TaxID=1299334 RepID=X8BL16_MYCXE|nr:peptidase M13 family protein [Mycobacterium xenopi 4042]